jgi:peptide/nickel transport system substrate-binding protein
MRHVSWLLFTAIVITLLSACASPASQPSAPAQTTAGAPPRIERTLVMILREEPPSVASKPLRTPGSSIASAVRLFNAELDYVDEHEETHPYLQEALPQIDTDTWRVFPDGRMQTTHRLREHVRWQDGTPLTPEDFVFAWRVYRTPELGASPTRPFPITFIDQVQVLDPRTIVLHWNVPFPDADRIAGGLPPLPRHILEAPLEQNTPDAFIAHPYWSTGFIGLGPYKLSRWEHGAFMEGTAFDGHILGRPKIQTVKVLFTADPNTALATILSGEAQIAVDNALKFEQAAILQREWGTTGGSVLLSPSQWRSTEFQFRPEVLKTPALLDVRVRRAMAHALDRQALNQVLLGGYGLVVDTPISSLVGYYPEIDKVITKYPYDIRRSQQLMQEAGFTRAADGFFVSASGERLKPDLQTLSGAQNEAELALTVDMYKQAGIDINPAILPSAQLSDARVRSLFPGMSTTSGGGGETGLIGLRSALPGPENQFLGGGGRGGWSNPEFDRLVDAYNGTLNKTERVRNLVEMARIFSEQLPKLTDFYNVRVTAHTGNLTGPLLGSGPDAGSDSWNVHIWEWRS